MALIEVVSAPVIDLSRYFSDTRRYRRIALTLWEGLLTEEQNMLEHVSGWEFALSCWSYWRPTKKPSEEPRSTRLATLPRQLGELLVFFLFFTYKTERQTNLKEVLAFWESCEEGTRTEELKNSENGTIWLTFIVLQDKFCFVVKLGYSLRLVSLNYCRKCFWQYSDVYYIPRSF